MRLTKNGHYKFRLPVPTPGPEADFLSPRSAPGVGVVSSEIDVLTLAHMTPSLLNLWREWFSSVPLYCESETTVGIDEVEDLRDFTLRETTKDQQRIEAYLKAKCKRETAIFHVGVGNSCLAKIFSPSIAMAVGITIQTNEVEHARHLQIPNYYPLLMNKYSLDRVCDRLPVKISLCA